MTRTTLPLGGKLLTAEQSVRLAILDSISRERAIDMIVRHIRNHSRYHPRQGRDTPRDWYSAPIPEAPGRRRAAGT